MGELEVDRDVVSPVHHYCTYFDINYVDKGVALITSLQRVAPESVIHVCCLDIMVLNWLQQADYPHVRLLQLNQVEAAYPDFKQAETTRSRVEYYFTLTPNLISYLFGSDEQIDELTYLDSDLFFFSSPEPLFHEMRNKSGLTAIIAHRFSKKLSASAVYGTFNVGWVTFTRSLESLACLADWRTKCVLWCYDRLEGDKFADQKYLDSWQRDHKRVVVLDHAGANVALWNFAPEELSFHDRRIYVGESLLIFYHFHGLRRIFWRVFFTNAAMYLCTLNTIAQTYVYQPYLLQLRRVRKSGIRSVRKMPFAGADLKLLLRHPRNGNFLFAFWRR